MRGKQEHPSTANRIRVFEHEGKQILLIDFSNCSAREVEEIARRVPDYVTTQPAQSVLILTDFTGADAPMKETAVFDKPFVKKSAFIGSGSLPQGFYEQLRIYSRRDLPVFGGRKKRLRGW